MHFEVFIEYTIPNVNNQIPISVSAMSVYITMEEAIDWIEEYTLVFANQGYNITSRKIVHKLRPQEYDNDREEIW
jgi:hypothetical protein